MKEITPQEATRLVRTHGSFTEGNIEQTTDKAYRVRLYTYSGGLSVFWVPLSVLKYELVKDTRKRIIKLQEGIVRNPNYGLYDKKYYVPKHFTKPHHKRS